MKKILGLFLFSAMLGFVACNNDDPSTPTAPTVSLDKSTAQDVPGANVTVKATVTAPGGGKSLLVTGGSTQTIDLAGATSVDKDVVIAIPASAVVGSTITVVFSASDNSNQNSAPVTLTITVGNPVITLQGNISANQTLDAAKAYLLVGQVFVKSGAVLTVPAGTVIKGDKASKAALIVEPGGQLVCNGTAEKPVVFTSAQPANGRDRGDWAGVLLLGSAWVNQDTKPSIEGITPSVLYGSSKAESATPTTNADQSSGILNYVRIEYAGIELTPNNETNGLTMGGVGNGTTIDHVQSSYGGDDSFEWFGGTVNAKHLVSFSAWDDDLDTDFGFRGNVQFALVVRYPFYADQSGSNAFESDNQGNANATNGCDFTFDGTGVTGGGHDGCTQAVFSNVTVLGPKDVNSRTISGSFQNTMHIRRRTNLSIFNSYLSGFTTGLRMDDDATIAAYKSGLGKLKNNVLLATIAVANTEKEVGTVSGELGVVYSTNTASGDATAVKTIWTNAANDNVSQFPTKAIQWSAVAGTPAGSVLPPYAGYGVPLTSYWGGGAVGAYPVNPDFSSGSGTLATGADYSDDKFGTFFDKTPTYIGAFGTSDWTDTWTEFQPGVKAY
ncbi:hypothetical protein SAMN04488109_6456 [Chryseolinea serpens]|uniref:Cell shape-determining protein MreB n=1 Tax=Chryseolinea serpens TaxID=947013 RepID=A0A1M5XF58_9BACT|nr:hypothetical protein [Chryseolinea serpens]SHH98188.1 hypothetical protein SAMN04488109_6456 [Chryseolinea serpens]